MTWCNIWKMAIEVKFLYCLEDTYFLNTAIRYYLKSFEEITKINKY